MLLVLLSPIILYLNKKTPLFYILSLLICWLLMAWVPYLPSAEATLFFSLGCYFAIYQKSLFGFDVYGKTIIASYIVVIILDVIFYGKLLYLQRFCILLGVVACLFMTKYLANSPRAKLALLKLSTASFFVYAAHEPLLSAVRKLAYKVIQPNSDYLILVLYLVIPVTVIMTLVFTYHKMVLVFPKFTRLITGGR